MKIAHGHDVRVNVFDIETLLELFDVGIYDPELDKWIEFEISKDRNDLYSFVKYYTTNKDYDYWISFNGINFDHQVLQYIVNNHDKWFDLTNLEICKKISQFVDKIIDDQKYGIPVPYKEYNFPVKPIDVFKIHHFDNEAKRTSLKWCEYMLNIDIEEMPVEIKQTLTTEDIKIVKNYRKNDVIATLCVFHLTLGELDKVIELIQKHFGYKVTLDELADYKGKNKIQDRFDVIKETGLPCLNWSDVKIGEEWNKKDYKDAENIKDDSLLFSKKIKHPYGQKFKNFFPKTMDFKTPLLKNFIHTLGETPVLASKQEFTIKIGKTTYTIAKGGIHSNEANRYLYAPKGKRLRDADVGSQYPNSIFKLKIYAPHLKETIIIQFDEKIKRRFIYKDKGNALKKAGKEEEARPYMGIQEMLKLCLNGGYYGKLGQPGSFLEYPEGLLKVCIGNQIEILMLIEMMEEAGFDVVSGNTDGIVVMFPEDKEDLYNNICAEWEEKVGNVTMGKLEYTDFQDFWQEGINSYIARKTDGKVKKKGKFLTSFDINKNKSKRVIALALEAYFIDKKNPIEFIQNHKNIFDFCIAKKASGDLHYEELVPQGQPKIYKKLIRYYISNDGNVFKKRGINNFGDPMDNHCEATDKDFPWMRQPVCTYFNRAFEVKDMKDYNINYSYYILETLKRIDKIEKTKKAKNYADTFKSKQIALF